ncbi:hypothetical protein, partial [Streptomyces sp. NPDC006996]|uniref:hypothetical protein n=1 Tax=Streptomyces sp. NPDC006996 TaxID=3156908 RepID=UPI0033DE392B
SVSAPGSHPPPHDHEPQAPDPKRSPGKEATLAQAAPLGQPHRSASRTAGTSPACAIRFGSSNAANTAAGLCEDFTYEVPCYSGLTEA